ncbi:sirohydrochlorin ferrochelatase [Saccharothrix saharensis]|uniref:Sirohydrochlorin ferrochelatase n=1 Tax=Saccharothrix saharensis TaxID=571190 RepID=A0A543JCK4_9PSEU|nr:sirohydrochlorin chelatase [Saccharothrix saharensis]TQM80514.1 sirohydrochlorin ferrochelatase [Saccharothrix saharensis]
MTALVAVAHGSRDPRSAAVVHQLLDVVRALAPSLDVRGSFLDLSVPLLGDVLRGVHADGHRSAVVVPLLLGKAFHARVDVPGAVADTRLPGFDVSIADVLGPDPRLESAALRRLASVGIRSRDRTLGVVLAGAGSSHAPANALVSSIAARWAAGSGWAGVEPAFAATAQPDVPTAVARLRARGARRIAVASWFLAPGFLPDRVTRLAGDAIIAPPLGPDPEVAELILHRYHSALAPLAASA